MLDKKANDEITGDMSMNRVRWLLLLGLVLAISVFLFAWMEQGHG